jgi:hypothetical protein
MLDHRTLFGRGISDPSDDVVRGGMGADRDHSDANHKSDDVGVQRDLVDMARFQKGRKRIRAPAMRGRHENVPFDSGNGICQVLKPGMWAAPSPREAHQTALILGGV